MENDKQSTYKLRKHTKTDGYDRYMISIPKPIVEALRWKTGDRMVWEITQKYGLILRRYMNKGKMSAKMLEKFAKEKNFRGTIKK